MTAELFQFKEVHWGDPIIFAGNGTCKVTLVAGTYMVKENILPLMLTWRVKVLDADKEIFVAVFDAKYKLKFEDNSASHFNDLFALINSSHATLQTIWDAKVLSRPLPTFLAEEHFDLINEILGIARQEKLI